MAALSAAVFVGTAETLGFSNALILAMAVAIVCGLISGAIVMGLGINAFIVTLGTLTTLRGMVLLYTDGCSLQVDDFDILPQMKNFEGQSFDVGVGIAVLGMAMIAFGLWRLMQTRTLTPMMVGMVLGGASLAVISWASGFRLVMRAPVIYTGALVGLVWFILNFTTIGRRVYAVGGNPEAARLSGVNVFAYKLGAFVFCSAVAGFAGVLFAARLRSMAPTSLQGLELTVIASAILGGTSFFGGAGSVFKTVAGALLLYSLTNGFNILNLGANYQGAIVGIVVVAAAAIYTVGGRGKR